MSFEYEGPWEEALLHSKELAGRKVRIQVVDADQSLDQHQDLFLHRAKPVKDLDSFLKSIETIPFEEGERLLEAIMQNRAERRQLARERD